MEDRSKQNYEHYHMYTKTYAQHVSKVQLFLEEIKEGGKE
jgi:hypothetical protein